MVEVEEDGETESKREGKVVDDAIPSESWWYKDHDGYASVDLYSL